MRRTRRGQDEYLQRVEDYIVQVRLSPMLLSPKEWTVAEQWKRDEIPLMVVFRGIDRAMRSLIARRHEFSKLRMTLSYCDKPVRAAFQSYLSAQSLFPAEGEDRAPIGAEARPEDSDVYYVLNRLTTLAKMVEALSERPEFVARRDSIAQMAQKLSALAEETRKSRAGQWLERVQTRLVKLDRELLRTARGCLSPGRRVQLAAQAKKRARQTKAPQDRSLIEYLMDGAVREEFGLPVIGLFDI
ncbi:MAG TPA: hypothetical protein VM163_06740 [bacterium]|nr:hypothetical protein [bacterium]